jgi:hypothetical protein
LLQIHAHPRIDTLLKCIQITHLVRSWRSSIHPLPPLSRRHTWTIALLTLLGAALRLRILDNPIEYDEAFTYFHYGAGTLWNAVSNYGLPNNHIFHSVCLWLSTRALGLSVLSLRLPVLVAGIALVPLTYLLGREASGSVAAAFSAALMAGCKVFAFYSVDARGYGLQAALFVAALLLTPRLVRQPSAALCAALAATTALALFTIPTLVFGVGSIFLWGLQLAFETPDARSKRTLWLVASALLAAALAGLLYAPAIDFALHSRIHWEKGYGARTFAAMCQGLLEYFAAGLPRYWAFGILVLVALDAVADVAVRRRIPLAVIWLAWPLCTLALHLMLAPRAPFPRNFLFEVPLLFVLAGRALELGASSVRLGLPAAGTRAAGLVAASAVALSTALPAYADYREAMRPGYLNSRYVFEQFMRPMRPGDELAAAGIIMDPVRIYAAIEGIPLSRMSQQWSLSIMQRSGPEGFTYPSLARPGQRFLMIVNHARERRELPFVLRRKLSSGELHWVARARLAPYTSDSPIVWELAAGPGP